MLFKEIVDARTDDGRRTPDIEGSQKLTEHFVLRWANNGAIWLSYYNRYLGKRCVNHKDQDRRVGCQKGQLSQGQGGGGI